MEKPFCWISQKLVNRYIAACISEIYNFIPLQLQGFHFIPTPYLLHDSGDKLKWNFVDTGEYKWLNQRQYLHLNYKGLRQEVGRISAAIKKDSRIDRFRWIKVSSIESFIDYMVSWTHDPIFSTNTSVWYAHFRCSMHNIHQFIKFHYNNFYI